MRIIMHIDMDAFFAAIEERERPELRGRAIVVGADPMGGQGRGVVSTANYAARKFGLKSAMPISQAWRLCPTPQCTYLTVDMRLYGIVSERIMKVVWECVPTFCHSEEKSDEESRTDVRKPRIRERSFAAAQDDSVIMEQVSVDEAYVDVSFCGSYGKAEALARVVKNEIKKRERLTCSVGVGPNKLIAKIASDFQKPDSLTVVKPAQVQAFLDPLPVRRLPGVGPKTAAELNKQGVETILDLRLSLSQRDELFYHAYGLDNTLVESVYEAKSIGHEITFGVDTRDQALLLRTAVELCDEVMADVRREGVRVKTVALRVRFDDFETHLSSATLRSFTASDTVLKGAVLKLLTAYLKKPRAVRLIGVRVSKFERR